MSKSLVIVASICFLSGFFIGKGKREVVIVHEKGKTHEKVVYRDVIKNKVVQSTRTVTRPTETIVDTKTEFFVAKEARQNLENRVEIQNQQKTETSPTRLWGFGVTTPLSTTPSSNLRFHVIVPVCDHISLSTSSGFKKKDVQVGLIIVF